MTDLFVESSFPGHYLDATRIWLHQCSDIFSLGVVFYQLLVGRLPFRGDTRMELLELITIQEPKPPRQADDAIPKELKRICLKATSKQSPDRYTTAQDMAAGAGRTTPSTPSHKGRLTQQMGLTSSQAIVAGSTFC